MKSKAMTLKEEITLLQSLPPPHTYISPFHTIRHHGITLQTKSGWVNIVYIFTGINFECFHQISYKIFHWISLVRN